MLVIQAIASGMIDVPRGILMGESSAAFFTPEMSPGGGNFSVKGARLSVALKAHANDTLTILLILVASACMEY